MPEKIAKIIAENSCQKHGAQCIKTNDTLQKHWRERQKFQGDNLSGGRRRRPKRETGSSRLGEAGERPVEDPGVAGRVCGSGAAGGTDKETSGEAGSLEDGGADMTGEK